MPALARSIRPGGGLNPGPPGGREMEEWKGTNLKVSGSLLLLTQNQFQLAQIRFCGWNARTPDILPTENKCPDDIGLPIGMVIGYWWPTA